MKNILLKHSVFTRFKESSLEQDLHHNAHMQLCLTNPERKFVRAAKVGKELRFLTQACVSCTSRGIVKICSLMQRLVLASDSPCFVFMSFPNPSFWSSVLSCSWLWHMISSSGARFQPLRHLSVHPRGKDFDLKFPQLSTSC